MTTLWPSSPVLPSANAENARVFSAGEAFEEATAFADLQTLYSLYGQRVFRFLLGTLRDRDTAEHLLQETFLRAWKARDQFHAGCSPLTWLHRIALNLVRDHTRTNRFRFWRHAGKEALNAVDLAEQLRHPGSSPEAQILARDQLALVWEAVATLTERQRTVFLLRILDELELSEIAAITGMPISTVKTHLYRGLAATRCYVNTPPPGKRKSASRATKEKQ